MSEPVVMRVGDRERTEVDAVLRDALADGVLTLTEYDERAAACWAARTRPELDQVVRDLPGAAPPTVPGQQRTHRVLAVMSETGLEAPLRAGQDVHATAVMGTAEVDLRREDLPSELTVRATAVMGEVKVHVPPGTTVHLTGQAVMGDRTAKVGPPVAGGAVVHVVGNAVMGTVKVSDRPRKGGLLPAVAEVVRRVPSQPAPGSRGGHPVHSGGRRRSLSRVVGSLLPVAVSVGLAYGVLQVVTAEDGAGVFSSRVVPSDDAGRVEVGVLFGSTTVVVPDDARVRTTGTTLFGSVDCDACSGEKTGPVVVVDGTGAFGSIEVVTRSEHESGG